MIPIAIKNYFIGLLILAVLGLGGYAYYSLRTDIHDNRRAIDETRNNLQSVAEYQQATDKRLDTVETGLAEARQTVGTVTGRIEVSQERLSQSADLITSGESVLGDIRKTGQ
jgi:septal ring factor EnvC (AmiA/AmiB activator)